MRLVDVALGDLKRIVVAIDPATTSGDESDLTGIVVVARGPHVDDACKLVQFTNHCPGHGYVLDDRTGRMRPTEWAHAGVDAYDFWDADRIVAEVNQGGDMVGTTIHAVRPGVPYTAVRASYGKHKRAEPVASLWEQGRVHLMGSFPPLEAQLTSWTIDSTDSHDQTSPDRMDAMVWGLTALGLIGSQWDAFLTYWRGDISKREQEPAAKPEGNHDAAAVRQLKRLMRSGPKYGTQQPEGLTVAQRRCTHRWRGDYCVFCSLTRAAV